MMSKLPHAGHRGVVACEQHDPLRSYRLAGGNSGAVDGHGEVPDPLARHGVLPELEPVKHRARRHREVVRPPGTRDPAAARRSATNTASHVTCRQPRGHR